MTSDWVKMRTDLYRDPKVIWIADSLFDPNGTLARDINAYMQCDMCVTRNVTRNATIGALVTVWGTIRHRGNRVDDDLVLSAAQLFTIDAIADLPGLGAAMAQVGWVVEDGARLVFPKFFGDLNYDPTEEKQASAAERQKRYRERKRDATRDVTVTPRSDIEKRRVEKRKVEKSTTKPPYPLSEVLPPAGDGEEQPPANIGHPPVIDPDLARWADQFLEPFESAMALDFNNAIIGRRPMKKYPTIWLEPHKLREAADLYKDQGIPPDQLHLGFRFTAEWIASQLEKGRAKGTITGGTFMYLTGMGLQEAKKQYALSLDIERKKSYVGGK